MEEGGVGNIEVKSMVVGDSTIGFVENANVGKGGSNVGTSENEVEAIALVMCVRGGTMTDGVEIGELTGGHKVKKCGVGRGGWIGIEGKENVVALGLELEDKFLEIDEKLCAGIWITVASTTEFSILLHPDSAGSSSKEVSLTGTVCGDNGEMAFVFELESLTGPSSKIVGVA